MMLIRYFPTNTKFPFMGFRRWSFPFSAAMSVLAVLLFFTAGMNFGIDFKGGTLVEMQAKGHADVASVRERAEGPPILRGPFDGGRGVRGGYSRRLWELGWPEKALASRDRVSAPRRSPKSRSAMSP